MTESLTGKTGAALRPLTIVASVTRDGVIGRDGGMPYHIPADLRHFKEVTLGHPVIMGRRTFESLPKGALPGRRNIVVTRTAEFAAPDVETASSLEEALALCDAAGPEPMVIGGGQVYSQAMPLATTLELTEIDATAPGGDTFFPEVDPAVWIEKSRSERIVDDRSGLGLEFVCWCRK